MRILFIYLFVAVSSVMEAQQVIVGRITNASNGQPVNGVNIFIANTTVATVSDASGRYRIKTSGTGSFEIVVVHIGFQSFEFEVRNREKVYFYKSSGDILIAICDEPIEIVNHEMGYHIQYVLHSFEHNYLTKESTIYGMPFFEELIPQNAIQKRRWEKRRKDLSKVSITLFIRSLYRDLINVDGFLLAKPILRDSSNLILGLPFDGLINVPSTDILQSVQDQIQVNIDSPLYLICYSKPITSRIIRNSFSVLLSPTNKEPVLRLPSQQFTIYSDGTYSGVMSVDEIRSRLTGLSSVLPNEYYESSSLAPQLLETKR